MIKRISSFTTFLLFIALTFWSAQDKTNHLDQLKSIKVGQSINELEFLGPPISQDNRELTYLLPNSSTLVVSIFENKIIGAWLRLKTPIKIDKGEWGDLEFVQMDIKNENPTWFFAGSANEGRVFKVNQLGYIEAITWIRPFSSLYQPRKLQALYQEFSNTRQM